MPIGTPRQSSPCYKGSATEQSCQVFNTDMKVRLANERVQLTSIAARLARPLGVVFVVALAVFAGLSVVAAGLWLLVAPAHSTGSGGVNSVPFALPGVAFRPAAAPLDRTGWRVSYVIANRTATYVLSALSGVLGGAAPGDGQRNRLVTLSDVTGHPYDERPDAMFGALPDATGRFYEVTIFPPLRAGATAVLVRHNVASGGTMRVRVDTSRAAAALLPVASHITVVSRGARLGVVTITRGALLSQLDLDVRGLPARRVGPGSAGTVSTILSWSPSIVTMRGATGIDLTPSVGGGPVHDGVATATIGFRTPPRGSLVTLIVGDGASFVPRRHAAQAHSWRVTFRMP